MSINRRLSRVYSQGGNHGHAVMDGLGERLARGDPAAWAELYDACADRVHHYLVASLRSREDADDALQETFVRLARTRSRLTGVENLVAYVFRIARNEAARLAARRTRRPDRSGATPAEALFEEAAGDDVQRREMAEVVAGALARLTPELVEVVELKTYAGLTFREIAEVTGTPQGTVATRYRSALAKMREWFARDRS